MSEALIRNFVFWQERVAYHSIRVTRAYLLDACSLHSLLLGFDMFHQKDLQGCTENAAKDAGFFDIS